jgi:tetratricopeptide (TPR) repeat protein
MSLRPSAQEEDSGDAAVKQGQLRDALQHYLTALQDLPENPPVGVDQSLREKIIKVVLQLNPSPAIPEEAIRHLAYAKAAVEEAEKDAKSSHLNDAVNELQQALRIAPWWAQGYQGLATVLQKTNRPGEAAHALQLYLLADPHAANAQDVQMEIYKLQYEAKQHQ